MRNRSLIANEAVTSPKRQFLTLMLLDDLRPKQVNHGLELGLSDFSEQYLLGVQY